MTNNIETFPIENLVISNIKNKKNPRLILGNKTYQVVFETPNVITPFGIDNAFGKFYIKLSLNKDTDNDFIVLLKKIENKLQTLIPTIISNFSNNYTINAILDKNMKLEDKDGNIISMFGIEKGDILKATIELGDIYNDKYYKWIVKKIVRMR
jgi:hypothetical protein